MHLLRNRLRLVDAIVRALDFLDALVDLLRLLLPLLLGHLHILLKHPGFGHAVGAAHAIKGSEELAVVDFETRMMKGVTGGTVDHRVVGEVLAIVNHDGPQVDKDEKTNIGYLLQREDEGENVVGKRLSEAVERVEGMAGEGSRHDPLVVSLVEVLIDEWEVQPSVSPVDAEIGKGEEERELKKVVPHSRAVLGGIIKLSITAHFGEKERNSNDGHDG